MPAQESMARVHGGRPGAKHRGPEDAPPAKRARPSAAAPAPAAAAPAREMRSGLVSPGHAVHRPALAALERLPAAPCMRVAAREGTATRSLR